MSESQYKDLESLSHDNLTDDLIITGESNTCCICNDPDNSLDEADPDLTQHLIECLGLDHDNRVNIPEKVGDCSICFNCKILLEEWKFSRDQETKFRIRIQQLKATLTAKILESSRKDSSWMRLPSRRGKSWGHKLRKIVSLNYDPIVRVRKSPSATEDDPYNNQVPSWENVDVAPSCSSSLQKSVHKEIPAIPFSPVQNDNPKLKIYLRQKVLSQRNRNLSSWESHESGGSNQGPSDVLIPKEESVQCPAQCKLTQFWSAGTAPMTAPSLTMENNCQAGSGVRPIMNTTTNLIGSSYPRQSYVNQPPVSTFQVFPNNYLATGEIISCSEPSCVPWGVVGSTYVSHPVVQAPCGSIPKAPEIFPVQNSSHQNLNPSTFPPASIFHAMPNFVPRLEPVAAKESLRQSFAVNGSRVQFPFANLSGGGLTIINKPARFRPILPNPPNLQHMVVSPSLHSGGQAIEQMQTHHETGKNMIMPTYPSNITPQLQQILSPVIADASSSSSQANSHSNTETSIPSSISTNAPTITNKRKEPPATSPQIPTKKANTQQIIPQLDESHTYHNIELHYMDRKFICGECNRYFEGPTARRNSHRHIIRVHLGYPWKSQPVKDLGDNNYLYGNKIPFRKYHERFICGACEVPVSGKKPDRSIIQHMWAAHYDVWPTPLAIGNDDNDAVMVEIKAETVTPDWETWTDESSDNNNYAYYEAQPTLDQDPLA